MIVNNVLTIQLHHAASLWSVSCLYTYSTLAHVLPMYRLPYCLQCDKGSITPRMQTRFTKLTTAWVHGPAVSQREISVLKHCLECTLNNCLEWDKCMLNELIHSRNGLTHLFHAGRQSVVWSTRSFGWSRLTALVGYRRAISL